MRGARLLEKIFGKKSTAVIYLLCAIFLLMTLAGNVFLFVFSPGEQALYKLLIHVISTAAGLAIITIPVLIQKRFKLFIPPFVEAGLCFATLLSFIRSIPLSSTAHFSPFLDLTPAVIGFVLAMSVFTVLYSYFDLRAEKKKRQPSLTLVILFTAAAMATMLVLFTASVAVVSTFRKNIVSLRGFLVPAAYYFAGGLLFCIIGCIAAHSRGDKFRIRSFKDPDCTKQFAKKTENRSLYTVVSNVSSDTTDYRFALRKAKLHFFLLRIFYLVVYAAYIVHTCIVFAHLKWWGYFLIPLLISSFLLTACVYVYEYSLYKKGKRNQRLRKLKIAKNGARAYSLALILAAMFYSDYAYRPLSAVLSQGMILFNLCLFFYNLFGKPKHYPSYSRQNIQESKTATALPAPTSNEKEAETALPPVDESKNISELRILPTSTASPYDEKKNKF